MQKVKFDGHEGVSQPDVDLRYRSRVEALSAAYLYTLQRELNITSIIKANLSW